MQSRTRTLIFRKSRNPVLAEIFAYSSKGVGGINLIGFGKYGNTLKEKIIFLCKERGLKLPFKKYVLCIENSDCLKDLEFDDLRWIELPLFLLLLQISDKIKICNLPSCISSGKINMNFMIIIPHIEKEQWPLLIKKWQIENFIYIGEFLPESGQKESEPCYLSLLQIMQPFALAGSGFEQVQY